MTTTTLDSSNSPVRRTGTLVLLSIGMLFGLAFSVLVALPYFSPSHENWAVHLSHRAWLLPHIGGGVVAILIGPFQLWMGFTGRRTPLHRTLGKVYMAAIALSSAAAYVMTLTTDHAWVFNAGLFGLATAWVTTTGMAYVAVRRRMFDQHKEWMIRSYVVTFGFVFFRVLFLSLSGAEIGTVPERLAASSWFCWAIPLLITEAILQGRKVFAEASQA